jgi:hypothetical protein
MISALKITAERIPDGGARSPMMFSAFSNRKSAGKHRRDDREILRHVIYRA